MASEANPMLVDFVSSCMCCNLSPLCYNVTKLFAVGVRKIEWTCIYRLYKPFYGKITGTLQAFCIQDSKTI